MALSPLQAFRWRVSQPWHAPVWISCPCARSSSRLRRAASPFSSCKLARFKFVAERISGLYLLHIHISEPEILVELIESVEIFPKISPRFFVGGVSVQSIRACDINLALCYSVLVGFELAASAIVAAYYF